MRRITQCKTANISTRSRIVASSKRVRLLCRPLELVIEADEVAEAASTCARVASLRFAISSSISLLLPILYPLIEERGFR